MGEDQIVCSNIMKLQGRFASRVRHKGGRGPEAPLRTPRYGRAVFHNYLFSGLGEGVALFYFKKSVLLCSPAGPGTWDPPASVF